MFAIPLELRSDPLLCHGRQCTRCWSNMVLQFRYQSAPSNHSVHLSVLPFFLVELHPRWDESRWTNQSQCWSNMVLQFRYHSALSKYQVNQLSLKYQVNQLSVIRASVLPCWLQERWDEPRWTNQSQCWSNMVLQFRYQSAPSNHSVHLSVLPFFLLE